MKKLAVLLASMAFAMLLASGAAWAAAVESAAAENYATDVGPYEVNRGDFDGDGDVDLAAANYGEDGRSSSVSVLPNRGDGTFRAATKFAAGKGPQSITAADLDGVGKPDLATANTFSDNVSVLLNTTQ